MRYDTEELRKLAWGMLPRAQRNLRKYGSLVPVALACRPDGYIDTFMFQWKTLEEKRQQQLYFQIELLKREAVAAVVILETWIKYLDDDVIDLSDPNLPVRDMPGRKDAVLVEAGSSFGRVLIVHAFKKLKSGRFAFDDPKEFSAGAAEMTSEFLDSIWRVHGGGDA